MYTLFWIRAQFDACGALTHQGCKWIRLKMPNHSDKMLELYPRFTTVPRTWCACKSRALQARTTKLRITWNSSCNFAYVPKFESFQDQNELILRSQIFFLTCTTKKFTFPWYFVSFLLQFLFSSAIGGFLLTTWRLMAGLPGFTTRENSLHLSAGCQCSNVTYILGLQWALQLLIITAEKDCTCRSSVEKDTSIKKWKRLIAFY